MPTYRFRNVNPLDRSGEPVEHNGRLAKFTGVIANALTDEVDEVLVVGHSSGAHLGVSILSDLIRQNRRTKAGVDQ